MPSAISSHSETILGVDIEYLKKLDNIDLDSLKVLDEIMLKYIGCLDGALDFSFQYYVDMFVQGKIDEKKCIEEITEHFKRFKDISTS